MKWQIRLSLHGLTRVDPVVWWGWKPCGVGLRERERVKGTEVGGPSRTVSESRDVVRWELEVGLVRWQLLSRWAAFLWPV